MKCTKSLILVVLTMLFALQSMNLSLFAQKKDVKQVMIEERKKEKERRRVIVGDNSWLEVHFLMKAGAYLQNTYDSSAGESYNDAVWQKGFHVKNAKIILNGQATEKVNFFVSTDDINIGDQGPASQYTSSTVYRDSSDDTVTVDDSQGTYIQDAYISYKIFDELQISVGMMLLPFMHHSRQSPVSLLGTDYNHSVIPLSNTTNQNRDTGIEFRGLLFNTATKKKGLLDYRIGVFRGPADRNTYSTEDKSDDVNRQSHPRYCGRIQLNIMDPETGFFYSGNYLGKKNVFSIGGGMDYQNHAMRNNKNNLKPYYAWTIDVNFDANVAIDYVLALQGAIVYANNSPVEDNLYIHKQYGFFIQTGVLIKKTIQPVIKFTRYNNSDINYKKDDLCGGLNYYIDGHRANIKLEYKFPLSGDHKKDPGEKKLSLQCQVFI